MAPTPTRVAVVVVNFASHALLPGCLEGLAGARSTELVVVDSFSTDEERASVEGLCRDRGWSFVPLETNAGFGAAANRGAAAGIRGGAEVVVLLNPDASISARDLADLAEDCVQHDALVCPRIESETGALWFAGGDVLVGRGLTRTRGVDVALAEHPWITGACLAAPTSLWSRLDGFDERYFMYWEDIDLSTRCVAAGRPVRVRRDLVAVHSVGGTQGRGKSDLYVRFNCRNRLLWAALHTSGATYRVWIRTSARYGWEVVRRGGRRAVLVRGGAPLVAALRGTLEGAWLGRSLRRRKRPARS